MDGSPTHIFRSGMAKRGNKAKAKKAMPKKERKVAVKGMKVGESSKSPCREAQAGSGSAQNPFIFEHLNKCEIWENPKPELEEEIVPARLKPWEDFIKYWMENVPEPEPDRS
ncbi:hypothetical protein MLD38_031267 [Melastoma candidum]|uniref:Uncharacterized protein n=1 Tax=Melastoma candidum TaxID=119954 RepID=A0ACB9MNI9_9MYRT|nr:hypothetical protein MLD38_031267 [Melastoma candidum]